VRLASAAHALFTSTVLLAAPLPDDPDVAAPPP
jgi:hypothetical protein